jgi:photosystem II stability/assembly factor-like uncharacterized protein
MKKMYITLILLNCVLVSAFGQWTTLNSGVTNTLRSPYFINGHDGIVVGEAIAPDQAIILKTTDGGATWVSKISGTTNALRAVHFIDDNTGFAVGFVGTILKTADGGETWNVVPSGTFLALRSLDFPSHDTGYIAADSGHILKTIDAGNTWTMQSTGLVQSVVNIRFINNNVGYAAMSTSFTNGVVIKTVDGGANWSTVYTDAQALLGIAVIDENTVIAGGGNNTSTSGFEFLIKTTNGGADWNQVYAGVPGGAKTFRGADFISPTTGWFIGDLGLIVKTEDGGDNWVLEEGTANGLLGIQFPNSDTGYSVGAGGTIIKYTSPCAALPSAGIINGSTTACSGASANYYITPVPGATTYTWSVPSGSSYTGGDTGIVVTFDVSSGDITVNAMNDCDTVSATLAVTVNPTPPVPIVSFVSGVLSSDAATGNQWYLNGGAITGATSQNYTPTQDGDYYVVVTNSFGCSATSATISVIGTGITAPVNSTLVNVYPNPFTTYTVLSLPANTFIENGTIEITDARGAIVTSLKNVNGNQWQISRGILSSGIYFYRLLDANNLLISSGKLVAN